MSDTITYQQYYDRLTAAGTSYTDLRAALKKLKVRSELLRYSAGLLSWLAAISLLLIGWFLLGGVLRLPALLRVSITAIWAGCAVWSGYIFVVKTLIKRTSIEKMAFHVEQCYPELQDRLISSLQLWPELPENKYGYSTNFIARVVEEAHTSLDEIDRSKILADDLRKFKRAGFAMIGVLLPLIIIIALFPGTFGDSLYAFAHPFVQTSEQITPVEITRVVPGDCTVQPGDDVDISADVTGPAPSIALLHYRGRAGFASTGNGQDVRAPGQGEWHTMPLSRVEAGLVDQTTTGNERRLKPATPSAGKVQREGAGDGKSLLTPLFQRGGLETVFAAKLQNLKESLEYYISVPDGSTGGVQPLPYLGAQSRQYSITVIQRPIISSLQLELHYPRYTGLPPQSLGMNVGDVVAPLGTKVVIEAISSKDVASGFVVFDDEAKTRLEVAQETQNRDTLKSLKSLKSLNVERGTTSTISGLESGVLSLRNDSLRKLTGTFLVQRSGRYYISITDTDGQSNSDPIRYSINALTDQPPRISIVQPGEDITIGEDMTIPLQIEAQDDYGVATVSLHYQVEGQDKKNVIQLGSYENLPQTSVSLKYTWDLGPLQLFPEDVVSYYAEAVDADNISYSPNVGRSPVFTARFPSLYELYKDMETEQQMQESEMEDILSRQDDVKETVDDLIGQLKKEKELDWAGKKELERAAELQRQIEEQMKNLASRMDETVHKAEESPLIGPEALEKLQELRDLIDEVATDEMKQIMRKLSDALEEINLSQQQRDLMAASFKQEEFIEKLDRMIELFKNMQLRQKLEVAANQAEELVRQQTETLEQSEQLKKTLDSGLKTQDGEDRARSEVLADREMRIQRQTEQLLSDLEEIAGEMKERLPNIAEGLEQIAERAKQGQISDQLQRASSELRNCCPGASLPFQLDALAKLSELQSGLQAALEAMKGQDASEIIAVLRDAIRSSLYLSHRHEEVMEATEAFENEPERMLPKEKEIMDSLAADEIDLAEGTKNVANKLRELSHKTTAIRPELVWNLERAADGLSRTAAAMEDKLPALAEPIQKNTLAVLNKAIEDMLSSIDQINAQAMPMMGMEDYMEQLRQLAEQQSQLNQSTQDADNLRRKQGITPSLEEMLEKLAIEQSLIRDATERLAAKLDQLAETLGRLEEVAREMQEVENSLRQGDLSEGTVEKQRRILARLLDYEKSLKRQDFSRKREARPGREYTVERPSSTLPADATRIQKQLDAMLSPKATEQWPMQYRELIRMYYKALSNAVRTQSGGAK